MKLQLWRIHPPLKVVTLGVVNQWNPTLSEMSWLNYADSYDSFYCRWRLIELYNPPRLGRSLVFLAVLLLSRFLKGHRTCHFNAWCGSGGFIPGVDTLHLQFPCFKSSFDCSRTRRVWHLVRAGIFLLIGCCYGTTKWVVNGSVVKRCALESFSQSSR